MINLTLSPRAIRFTKMWALNFAKIMSVMMIAITIGGTIGYLIILAGQTYGFKLVIGGIALAWLLALAVIFSGYVSECQLNDLEHEEDKVMRKLRDQP